MIYRQDKQGVFKSSGLKFAQRLYLLDLSGAALGLRCPDASRRAGWKEEGLQVDAKTHSVSSTSRQRRRAPATREPSEGRPGSLGIQTQWPPTLACDEQPPL